MQLTTSTFRGVKKATLSLDAITLLAGPVGQGKTSILDGLRACLLGSAVPLSARPTKEQKAALIHHGATGSTISYGDDQGAIIIELPSGEVRSQGDAPPPASRIACGIDSIPDMNAKDRADALGKLLKTEPGEAELIKALTEAGLPEAMAKGAAKEAIKKGFDTSLAEAKKSGAEAKGAWQQITGETYGSAKAAAWTPRDWDHDLGMITDGAELKNALDAARVNLDAAIKAGGANEAELARMSESVAKMEGVRREVERLDKESRSAADRSRIAARDLDALPEIPDAAGHPCPHCSALIGGAGPYHAVSSVSDPEASTKRRAERKAVIDKIAALDAEANAAAKAFTAAQIELKRLEHDKAALDQLIKSGGAKTGAQTEAQAREAVEVAKRRMEAWVRRRDADIYHHRITDLSAICKVLAPDGLRKVKLVETIQAFNGRLDALCEAADIETISLDDGLDISLGGRPYASLSTGEQYIVRTVIQIAVANIDGSSAVVVDIDRPLDRWALSGIVSILAKHTEALALVAVTLTKPTEAPDLGKGIGDAPAGSLTYWVQDGEVQELSAAIAAGQKVAA